MDGRIHTHHEFAAVIAALFCFGQGGSVFVQDLYLFLCGLAQLSIDRGFIITMDASGKEQRTAPQKAAVLLTPFHELRILRRLFLDLCSFHEVIESRQPPTQDRSFRRVLFQYSKLSQFSQLTISVHGRKGLS